MVLMTCHSGAW